MKIVGVSFNDNNKQYYFNLNDFSVNINTTVIVETEKGLQFGKVMSYIDDDNVDPKLLKNVLRITSKKDYLQHLNNIKDAQNALIKAQKLINNMKLNMKLVDANYTFDRNQLIFRFLADERVDFRQLAKELGAMFKTRIELRQIGIRDKAKEIGGIGPCGRILCCSKFLHEFDSVSINMAKNQSLALNPTKINGVCGRLLCCLKYEDSTYTEYRKAMPELGQIVKTPSGSGKVISLDILNKKYKVLVNDTVVVMDSDNDSKK